MFNKLKEKLKSWTKKVSEEIKEIPEETKKESEKKVSEKKKLTEPPMKFKPGLQKFEPDLEKIKENIQESTSEKIQEQEGKKSFIKKVTSKISKVKISEETFNIYAEELELLLLENNVALEVTEKIIEQLKEKIIGKELLKKEIESEIQDSFKEIIEEILIEPFDLFEKIKEKTSDQSKEPYIVLFCGINGVGKTTCIAKVAKALKEKNVSCVLAAADTFRAASIEQLKKHGENLGVKVVANEYGSDPASVGFDAIQYAKKNLIDCVLIDTAGRMHTSKNLLKEIEKIARVCKPDTKIFVGESLTGNDAIEQVKSFDWEIGIDGIILTKADIDEKGGTALSVGFVTKKPILYLGTGQEMNDIIPFKKNNFIKTLGLDN